MRSSQTGAHGKEAHSLHGFGHHVIVMISLNHEPGNCFMPGPGWGEHAYLVSRHSLGCLMASSQAIAALLQHSGLMAAEEQSGG